MIGDPFPDYFALSPLFAVITLFYAIIAIHDIPYLIAKRRNCPHQNAIHAAGRVSIASLDRELRSTAYEKCLNLFRSDARPARSQERVIDVPVQTNAPPKQGEVLFRIDPKPHLQRESLPPRKKNRYRHENKKGEIGADKESNLPVKGKGKRLVMRCLHFTVLMTAAALCLTMIGPNAGGAESKSSTVLEDHRQPADRLFLAEYILF